MVGAKEDSSKEEVAKNDKEAEKDKERTRKTGVVPFHDFKTGDNVERDSEKKLGESREKTEDKSTFTGFNISCRIVVGFSKFSGNKKAH